VKQTFNMTRGLILAAMLGLMIVAGLGMQAQQADTDGLERASQENLYWNIAQIEVELARFVVALARFNESKFLQIPGTEGQPPVDAEFVNNRFNILWSRADVFRAGKIGRRMHEIDHDGRIGELFDLLERNDARIVAVDDLTSPEISAIISEFSAFSGDLRKLTNLVVRAEERRFADFRGMVRESSRLTLFASIGAMVLAVLLIAIMLYETRRYRLMAEESAALARAAEAAAKSKSRFLTMMSHELRTPMNGVLGMLELVRQTPINEPQQRLIEQAQRSGGQMIGLLGDILDLSDLQEDRIDIRRAAFGTPDLAASLEEMLAAEVQRGGLALNVSIRPGTPARLEGDQQRIRQIVRYVVAYLVEVVGSQRIDISIDWADGLLQAEVETIARGSEQPGWRPQDMFERSDGDYGNFASDALGPMIARGLSAAIGGQITLKEHAGDRIAVIVTAPAERVIDIRPRLRIAVSTGTLELVLKSIATQLGWQVWESATDDAPVAAVLVQAGDSDEVARAADLRERHPDARIIGIGMPLVREMFDDVCDLPPSTEAIQGALDMVARQFRAVS